MDHSKVPLLTPYNYATWNQHAWNALMQLGYTPYVENEVDEPKDDKEKIKRMLEHTKSLGCLRSFVSLDLMFQIESCTNSHDAWEKLKFLYGITNEVKGYQIENELMSLDPKNFGNIQDYTTKVNDLKAQCKACGIDKKDIQLIYNTLNKLGPEFAAFVYSFHTHRLTMGFAYTMPSFASFSEMLMHEQQNLLSMGLIKPSQNQALLASQPKG